MWFRLIENVKTSKFLDIYALHIPNYLLMYKLPLTVWSDSSEQFYEH